MSKRRCFGVSLVLMLLIAPSICHANIFDSLGEEITKVTGLRGIAKGTASGASEEFRKQLEEFIDNKIDPLLDRANALVAQRLDQVDRIMTSQITQTANEMIRALYEAEKVLNSVIDHAGEVVEQILNKAFQNANSTVDRLFVKIDPLMEQILCILAPAKKGLQISGIPFAQQPDEIRVRWPARTQCYRKLLATRYKKNPSSEVFSRMDFFDGEMCEIQLNAEEISPSDPDSLEKLKRAYEQLAGMAASAICYASTPIGKNELLTKELKFEKKVRLISSLLDQSSILLH